jgi:RNA polymerase-interacting CarD/CdnL/TRCF family regulator
VDGLIKVIIQDEADKAFAQLQNQYENTYSSISYQYQATPELMSRNVALLSANYVKGLQKTEQNLESEATRLSVISSKVLAGAKAVDAINKMANDEIMLYDTTMAQFMSAITNQSVADIIKTAENKYYPQALKEP